MIKRFFVDCLKFALFIFSFTAALMALMLLVTFPWIILSVLVLGFIAYVLFVYIMEL